MYFSTAREMERLDKLAVKYGLEIRQMMELAGWHILSMYNELDIKEDKQTVIVCGRGNKGGDGLAAARNLINQDYPVSIIILDKNLKTDPQHHLDILKEMKTTIVYYQDNEIQAQELIKSADVIIDAMLGYHLDGNPREPYKTIIEHINSLNKTVIAYDLPSGMDASNGQCMEPCIKATITLTLALPKKVFQIEGGRANSGKVFLADIGIPEFLYDKVAQGSRPEFGPAGYLEISK